MRLRTASFFVFLMTVLSACSSGKYNTTVEKVDIPRFMGDWHVIAGRFTFLEDGAHNGLEQYTWNEKEKRIDIKFSYNDDSFTGERDSLNQKAWIENKTTNAHWKVSPFWPLKLDYLVIALAKDYSWTAVGVPSGKYLWIMARKNKISDSTYKIIISELEKQGYPTENIIKAPQK